MTQRLSRNQNPEYLSQRRKDRKENLTIRAGLYCVSLLFLAVKMLSYEVGSSVNITKRARRFFTRHSSVNSKQAGASLP